MESLADDEMESLADDFEGMGSLEKGKAEVLDEDGGRDEAADAEVVGGSLEEDRAVGVEEDEEEDEEEEDEEEEDEDDEEADGWSLEEVDEAAAAAEEDEEDFKEIEGGLGEDSEEVDLWFGLGLIFSGLNALVLGVLLVC